MKKILITGARGFLGATLMRVFPSSEYEALAFQGDITDAEATLNEIKEIHPDWIVHAAAKTDVGLAEREPEETHAVNVTGTLNVVRAAKEVGAKLLHVSTASVFSGITGDYTEQYEPEPGNVYNKSKHAAEKHVLAYENGVIVRLNPIGVHPDGSRGKNFLEWMIGAFKENKDISLFTDSRINPLSNWTIAELLLKILESSSDQRIFHIGSNDVVSKAQIGEWVQEKYPEYSGAVTLTSLDSIADGVVRPKEMWINHDRSSEVLGVEMPSARAEVERIFKEPPF